MALIDRLRAVQDRLGTLNTRFGLPQYPAVTLRGPGGDVVVTPSPRVTSPGPSDVRRYEIANVEALETDLALSGLSRTYPRTQVAEASYVIGGRTYRTIWVDDTRSTTWSILLREVRNR
jgi:hypothetical protein